jgi:hypothetical protein
MQLVQDSTYKVKIWFLPLCLDGDFFLARVVYTGGFQGRQRLSSVDPSTPSPLLPLVTAELRGVPGSLGGGGSCIEVGLGSLAIVPRRRLLYHRLWLVPSSKSPVIAVVLTSFSAVLARG